MFKFDLQANEKLVSMTRQAESVLIKYVFIVIIVLYIPITFLLRYSLLERYITIILIWIVLVTLFAINKYLLWLLNVTLVTNQRVITIAHKNFFNREVSQAPLVRISHISQKRKGFFQTILGYGDILINLEGIEKHLIIKNIKNPQEFSGILWESIEKSQKNSYFGKISVANAEPQE